MSFTSIFIYVVFGIFSNCEIIFVSLLKSVNWAIEANKQQHNSLYICELIRQVRKIEHDQDLFGCEIERIWRQICSYFNKRKLEICELFRENFSYTELTKSLRGSMRKKYKSILV